MLKQLISFFVRNPLWANAILVLTLLFGLVSLFTLDSSFFPLQDSNYIRVTVFYNGASPQEMEDGVTIKIEQAIKGIQGIEEISSNSYENYSNIFIETFKSADIDEVLRDVENAVNSINSFPSAAEKPTILKLRGFANSRASFISLTGSDDLSFLKSKAKEIEDDLLKLQPISSVTIGGYPEEEFEIAVEEKKLQRYNLTFDDIAVAFRTTNIDRSAGTIKTKDEEFIIRTKQKKKKVSDIETIVIRTNTDGSYLYLSDIAKVRIIFKDSPRKNYVDGKRGITIVVKRLENEDLEDITKAVENYVKEFNIKNDKLKLRIMFQFYDLLKQRINTLAENGLSGLILVIIILGLFLSLRVSFWVAMGIPVSFLGMFILGALAGITINMISLFGMILVVGILVDDGIVVAENIYHHYENGKSALRATIDGTAEVATSVITSVLTTVAAFSTLLFVEGMERMYEMALSVIFALLFSLIEAFFILPIHLKSNKLGKNKIKKDTFLNRVRIKLDKGIIFLRDSQIELLKFLIVTKLRRRLFAFLPLLFIMITYLLLNKNIIQSTFFPVIDFDDINVEIAFKPGEREEKTEKFLWYCYDEVEKLKKELKKEYGKDLITYITLKLGTTNNLEQSGAHCGSLQVNLELQDSKISARAIAKRIRKRITPDPLLEKYFIGAENLWGKPIEVSIEGDDYNTIIAAKRLLKEELNKMPELKEVTDNSGLGKREIIFELNQKAKLLGLSEVFIAKQIRQGFFGEELQRLIVDKEEYRVWVRYNDIDRKGIDNFENLKIKTQNGELIPLSELINYKIERGIVSLFRFNGERNILVEASQTDALASTKLINEKIEEVVFPKVLKAFHNVKLSMMGQSRKANKTQKSMGFIMIILFIILLLILSLNFNSFWQSLLFIPVIAIGPSCAILGHGLEDKPVSLLSTYGIIALMGVLINDAVVFLDKFNTGIKSGKSFYEAMIDTVKNRFRPIILTTITTCAGLYPLILETDFQVQFLVPMAISVVYGILFGTFFILTFFPLLLWVSNDIRRFFIKLITGKTISEEGAEPVSIIARERKVNKTLNNEI